MERSVEHGLRIGWTLVRQSELGRVQKAEILVFGSD